mgnify:CR=1 FL=1
MVGIKGLISKFYYFQSFYTSYFRSFLHTKPFICMSFYKDNFIAIEHLPHTKRSKFNGLLVLPT